MVMPKQRLDITPGYRASGAYHLCLMAGEVIANMRSEQPVRGRTILFLLVLNQMTIIILTSWFWARRNGMIKTIRNRWNLFTEITEFLVRLGSILPERKGIQITGGIKAMVFPNAAITITNR